MKAASRDVPAVGEVVVGGVYRPYLDGVVSQPGYPRVPRDFRVLGRCGEGEE